MERDGERIEITISSRFENIELVQVIAEHLCENAGLDEDGSHWIGMAVREAVANAIKHGNKLDVRKKVLAVFELTGAVNFSPRIFSTALISSEIVAAGAATGRNRISREISRGPRPEARGRLFTLRTTFSRSARVPLECASILQCNGVTASGSRSPSAADSKISS